MALPVATLHIASNGRMNSNWKLFGRKFSSWYSLGICRRWSEENIDQDTGYPD
jgi:hypothetical protein